MPTDFFVNLTECKYCDIISLVFDYNNYKL